MAEYIFLMHADSFEEETLADWDNYIARLEAANCFLGGSVIGSGECFRAGGQVPVGKTNLSGFIRVVAENLAEAARLLNGNPAYEAGATVEIRELPQN